MFQSPSSGANGPTDPPYLFQCFQRLARCDSKDFFRRKVDKQKPSNVLSHSLFVRLVYARFAECPFPYFPRSLRRPVRGRFARPATVRIFRASCYEGRQIRTGPPTLRHECGVRIAPPHFSPGLAMGGISPEKLAVNFGQEVSREACQEVCQGSLPRKLE